MLKRPPAENGQKFFAEEAARAFFSKKRPLFFMTPLLGVPAPIGYQFAR
jgi:hypothetical protein